MTDLDLTQIAGNRKVITDLTDQLREAWERILNAYAETHDLKTERGGVRYIDAQMALHNFHKHGLDHIVDGSTMTPADAAVFYASCGRTFTLAMDKRWNDAMDRAAVNQQEPRPATKIMTGSYGHGRHDSTRAQKESGGNGST